MMLAQPLWLLLILLLPIPWLLLRRRGYFGSSTTHLADGLPGNIIVYKVPLILMSLALIAAAIALSRPQEAHVLTQQVKKARDIIIAVDTSGSMGESFLGEIPKRAPHPELDKQLKIKPRRTTPSNQASGSVPVGKRRIDAAQYAVIRFVENRFLAKAGDRVGILTFDDMPRWSWPLTHDLKMIYRNGEFVDQGLGGGTNFGAYTKGPIDAAIDHFDEMGQSETRAFIMITDGEANLNSDTFYRLVAGINRLGIRFYVIGVGEALAHSNIDILQLVKTVGGKAYRVENANDLAACFDEINRLEQSLVQTVSSTDHEQHFYYFAAAAMILLLLGVTFEALILSQ